MVMLSVVTAQRRFGILLTSPEIRPSRSRRCVGVSSLSSDMVHKASHDRSVQSTADRSRTPVKSLASCGVGVVLVCRSRSVCRCRIPCARPVAVPSSMAVWIIADHFRMPSKPSVRPSPTAAAHCEVHTKNSTRSNCRFRLRAQHRRSKVCRRVSCVVA